MDLLSRYEIDHQHTHHKVINSKPLKRYICWIDKNKKDFQEFIKDFSTTSLKNWPCIGCNPETTIKLNTLYVHFDRLCVLFESYQDLNYPHMSMDSKTGLMYNNKEYQNYELYEQICKKLIYKVISKLTDKDKDKDDITTRLYINSKYFIEKASGGVYNLDQPSDYSSNIKKIIMESADNVILEKREIQKENKKKQYADSDISTDVLDKIHEVFLDSVGKITISNSDKMLNYMSGQVLKLFKMNPIIIKEQFQNKIQKLNLQ